MRTPRISARALVIQQNAVLVTEYEDEAGVWYTLPGGGQQHGEDLVSCVQREMLEEIGWEVTVGKIRFVRELINEEGHSVSIIFECQVDRDRALTPPTNPDPGQIGWKWLELDQLAAQRFYPRKLAQALQNNDDSVYIGNVN